MMQFAFLSLFLLSVSDIIDHFKKDSSDSQEAFHLFDQYLSGIRANERCEKRKTSCSTKKEKNYGIDSSKVSSSGKSRSLSPIYLSIGIWQYSINSTHSLAKVSVQICIPMRNRIVLLQPCHRVFLQHVMSQAPSLTFDDLDKSIR